MSRRLVPWLVVVGLCGLGNAPRTLAFSPDGPGFSRAGGKADMVAPGPVGPRVSWEDALPDIFRGAAELVREINRSSDKGGEEYRDEQEAQWEREEAEQERERERAALAEEEAQWQREEAERERERAEIAEENEAAAREEAYQSREAAEEARSTAEAARSAAQQAGSAAEEARGAAQEAQGIARQAESAAQRAGASAQAAKETSEQARGAAQEAQGAAQQAIGAAQEAKGTAVAAQRQVQEAHQRVGRQNTFVVLLALLTLLALVLALRKPRQAMARAAGNAIEPLSRRFKPEGNRPGAGRAGSDRVVLTGFDNRGRPVSIPLPGSQLDPKQGGFTLGRHHLLVDKALEDERISKRHVRFSYDGHGFFVEDLNSSNGTTLNGSRPCPPFKPVQVRPGDTVRLGGMELMVSG